MPERLGWSDAVDAEDRLAAFHEEGQEHDYGDARCPFDLAARLADRWGLGLEPEGATIKSTGIGERYYSTHKIISIWPRARRISVDYAPTLLSHLKIMILRKHSAKLCHSSLL
jgi:hypothetical protein